MLGGICICSAVYVYVRWYMYMFGGIWFTFFMVIYYIYHITKLVVIVM